jgi:hypothetical protein
MTVGIYTGCASAAEVERAAAEAGFSQERIGELIGVWYSREAERQAQREAAGLRPFDEARDATWAEWNRLMQVLVDTPAVSLAGLLVKLRQIAEDIGPDDEICIYTGDLVRSALRDAERLAGGVA